MTESSLRTKKVQIVLLGGKMQVGKTTSAQYLAQVLNMGGLYVQKKAFASRIKEIARAYFGWDGKKDEKGRRLLQILGTDAGRAYNPDIWVSYMDEDITGEIFPPNFVFIDDWRFPNEKEYFLNNFLYEVTSILIKRDMSQRPSVASHESENSLPDDESYFDFVIENDGNMEELFSKLDNIVAYLKTKIIED